MKTSSIFSKTNASRSTIFLTILFFATLFYGQLSAQQTTTEKPLRMTAYVGFPTVLFGFPKSAIHFGINPMYQFNEKLAFEAQFSYSTMSFSRKDGSFTHDGGSAKNINVLGGLRWYFIKNAENFKPYFSLLAGYGQTIDKEYNANNALLTNKTQPFGFSVGLFGEIKKRFNIGFGAEGSAITLFAKLGYTF